MGYKLRSGQTIVDDDGNLNVIHGATLHIAGDLYANNQTGLDLSSNTQVSYRTVGQIFQSTNPLHVGSNYGYYAGGDTIGHSRYNFGSDDTTFALNQYHDFLEPRFVDPTAPSPSPGNRDVFDTTMAANHNVSKFPFAITNASMVTEHAELAGYTGARNNNQLLGTALSDGHHGYYAGGINVYTTGPNPSPTGTSYVTLQEVSKYPFAVGGGGGTDAGELAVRTFQATGHNSKSGHGYVIFTRHNDAGAAPDFPSSNDYHIQKMNFASGTPGSVTYTPTNLGYVGHWDISLDPLIPSGITPNGASPPGTGLHGHAGWTDNDNAYIGGGAPSIEDGFDNAIKRFNFNSQTFAYNVGSLEYDGPEPGYSPLFPQPYRKAGASISSISDGYWIGSGNEDFNYFQHTAIRRFPFANMARREESVEGYQDSLFPLTKHYTYYSTGQQGLEFIGAENFPSVQPGENAPSPFSYLFGRAPFFLAATGHASTDYGFVSHLEGPATIPVQQGQYNAPSYVFGFRSYILKFPYANATHIVEVSESAPFTSTPVANYPQAVQMTTDNVLVARGMMGQTGTVS